MAQLSDEEFIAQVRDRSKNRRKYITMAVLCFAAATIISLIGAYLAYQQWIAIVQTVTPTTTPFWLGIALGCLLGTKLALVLALAVHGTVSLVFASRGGERTQRLLLERHDALRQLLDESPNPQRQLTDDPCRMM